MRKLFLFVLAVWAAFIAFLPVEASADSSVYSWVNSTLKYNVTLPPGATITLQSLYAHGEIGYDISSGVPAVEATSAVDTTDPDWPYAYAYAHDPFIYGDSDAMGPYPEHPENQNTLWAYTWSDNSDHPETWGRAQASYRVHFGLSESATVTVSCLRAGGTSNQAGAYSDSESGSAFALGLASVYADNYSILLWDSDPENDDYLEVHGIGGGQKNYPQNPLIEYTFGPGAHDIAITADAYSNASVPLPGAIFLLGPALAGLAGLRRRLMTG